MQDDDEARAGGQTTAAGSPNSDGPGNAAWQDATAMLREVQQRESEGRF